MKVPSWVRAHHVVIGLALLAAAVYAIWRTRSKTKRVSDPSDDASLSKMFDDLNPQLAPAAPAAAASATTLTSLLGASLTGVSAATQDDAASAIATGYSDNVAGQLTGINFGAA